jgi:GntR family transcriptional repressor for pyruvate dehydrogenase complex
VTTVTLSTPAGGGKVGMAVEPDGAGPAQWQPVARSRTHELVIAAIEEQIMSDTLRVGDSLPAERDLAAKLQVSRSAVREAFRVLEAQGVLRSAVGSGAGAGTFVAAMPSDALTRFLRLHIALANFAFADVVEARVTLERSSVALAAREPDRRRLAAVREAVEIMDSDEVDRATFNDADTAFHVAIAEAGGNRLVTALTVAIRNAMRGRILAGVEQVADWPALRQVLRDGHHAILVAIEAGDATTAASLAEHHIRDAYARLPALHFDDGV